MLLREMLREGWRVHAVGLLKGDDPATEWFGKRLCQSSSVVDPLLGLSLFCAGDRHLPTCEFAYAVFPLSHSMAKRSI